MSLLEINGLTRRFGGLIAVNDFNIELGEHELVALIGPNGAGKTTVFNLISGFYQPSEGSIRLNGTDTKGLRPHQVTALGVARTFQGIRLWGEMHVLDNIRIAQHYRLGYSLMDCFLRTKNYVHREKAIDAIAEQAIVRNTGARGLRSIVENLLVDVMFDLPSDTENKRVLVTRETVVSKLPPIVEGLKKSA